MWGRLATELIHHIVDLLVADSGARSLYKLSLVNKAFLAYARRCLFQDLSINICRNPYIPTHTCHTPRCIKQLALLLKTRVPPSIPRRIRTLTINGRDVRLVQYLSFWRIVSNPGAMDDESVTVPVLGYFKEVEELRLVQVNLYPLSYRASLRRPLTFLSSVRTLVLDDAGFYAGPALLHSFISEIPNLERLFMKGVDWPSEKGLPNNASKGLILLMNGSVYYPRTCDLLLRISGWSRRVRETLFPQQWKPVTSSPSHLTLYLNEARAALSWLVMPVLSEMLSKLSSLEIYSWCTVREQDLGDDNLEFLLKQLLASAPKIVHFTFRWRATRWFPAGTLFQPDFSSCTSLRTLHLQIVCEDQTWLSCRAWLHSTTHSIRGLPLERVQVTMDLNVADMSFEGIDEHTSAADECLCREDLAVEVRIGMFDKPRSLRQPTHTPDELIERGWSCVRNAFSLRQERQSFLVSVKAGRWL